MISVWWRNHGRLLWRKSAPQCTSVDCIMVIESWSLGSIKSYFKYSFSCQSACWIFLVRSKCMLNNHFSIKVHVEYSLSNQRTCWIFIVPLKNLLNNIHCPIEGQVNYSLLYYSLSNHRTCWLFTMIHCPIK